VDRDTRYWFEQGEASARNPHGWLDTADALKRSADILLAESDDERRKLVDAFAKGEWASLADELADVAGAPFLWPVYLQLAGLAIENLAKGIAVAGDPSIVEADKRGRLLDWGHISAKLVDELGIRLEADEVALVEKLRVYVDWAGRYPVPLFALKLAGSRTFKRASDPAGIDALYARLRSELLALAPTYEERGEQERQERGRQALRALSGLPKHKINDATLFVAEGEPEEPAAVVTCVACKETFTLSPNQPGGFCGCGNLHWYELIYDGSLRSHIPLTQVLYGDESGGDDSPNSRSAHSGQ
jgi:hypothetical protein